MIVPPGLTGVAFSESSDGDIRHDEQARSRLCQRLGIAERWATVRQVHGSRVVEVSVPGESDGADALWTTEAGLPLAVFTADCLGVVAQADSAVGVAHAGWRGASAGVVANLIDEMGRAGHKVRRAVIGPGIASCCYEVGPEVAQLFPGETSTTTWGTVSVDLSAVVKAQLPGVETMSVAGCTRHDDRFFSHRRDGTARRLATVAWL